MKRRDFLEASTKILCACAAGSGLALVQGCTSNVATSPDPNEESEELIIDLLSDGFTALLEQGGSVVTDGNIIDSQGLLLYRTGNEVRAFRNNCTTVELCIYLTLGLEFWSTCSECRGC